MGLGEMWRSWNKTVLVRERLERLMPEISAKHVGSWTRRLPACGAQAITPDGKLLDDFAFFETSTVRPPWSRRRLRRPRPCR